MRILALLALLAVACQAQTSGSVPRPPWAGGAKAKGSSPAGSNSNDDSTIKVNVKLVNVFVTVTDQNGSPVGNLTKENFQLLEDDVPQTISIFSKESALPLSIALEIDTSLSTRRDLPL